MWGKRKTRTQWWTREGDLAKSSSVTYGDTSPKGGQSNISRLSHVYQNKKTGYTCFLISGESQNVYIFQNPSVLGFPPRGTPVPRPLPTARPLYQ